MLVVELAKIFLAVLSILGTIIIYSVFVRFNAGMLIAYFQRACPHHILVRNFGQDRMISNSIAWMGPIVTLPIMLAVGFPNYGLRLHSEEDRSSKWFHDAIEDADRRGLLQDHNRSLHRLEIEELSNLPTDYRPSNRVPGKCISIWRTPNRWKKKLKKSPENRTQGVSSMTFSHSVSRHFISSNS